MVPFVCRLFIFTASFLVPQSKRREWRKEWEAELWHRAEMGASGQELLRRASGVFRDAAWFRENEIKQHGYDLFRTPLRAEAIFLGIALLTCLFSGAFQKPTRPFADAAKVVVWERNLSFAAAIVQLIDPKLIPLSQEKHAFADVAGYRVQRLPMTGAYAARNFFDLLGSKPLLGRTFRADESVESMVLTYDLWRGRFHSDPNIVGKRVNVGRGDFTVIGVMPPEFWFITDRLQWFAPIQWYMYPGGAVARLKPGDTVAAAQQNLRRLASTLSPRWVSDSFMLVPLLEDNRLADLLFSFEVALIAALVACGFFVFRRHGGPRFWLVLAGRVFLVVSALALLRMSLYAQANRGPGVHSLFAYWLFLMVCCAATTLLVIDHRQRCLVCIGRLRKPVAIGSYASQILDQPATEYLCPAGHGTLYVAETGNAPDHWTVFDKSWRDLFAHTER